jgi:hypothetical protein
MRLKGLQPESYAKCRVMTHGIGSAGVGRSTVGRVMTEVTQVKIWADVEAEEVTETANRLKNTGDSQASVPQPGRSFETTRDFFLTTANNIAMNNARSY